MPLNSEGLDSYRKQKAAAPKQAQQNVPADTRAPAGLSKQGLKAYQQGVMSQRAIFAQEKVRSGEMDSREAADWYTGRNDSGEDNGWDSEFTNKYWKGWTKALKEGKASEFFDKGTGVVTWDHKTKAGNEYKFGDIVIDGKVEDNVYDAYDEDQAALMMAPWLLTGKEQAHAFKSAQRTGDLSELKEKIAGYKEMGARSWKDAQDKASFNRETRERAEDDGFALGSTIANTIAATVSGAALGGGLGAAPGALIGGGVGFVTSLLNRDQMVEQSARAVEKIERSYEQNKRFGDIGSTFAAFGTGVEEAFGLWNRDMSLFSNAVQGTYDMTHGGWDRKNAFYAVDGSGQRKAGKVWRGADIAAAFGDSLLQFSSKTGQVMYTAQMGGQILGKGTTWAASGGNKFNPYSGNYQSTLMDDEGSFSPGRAVAGALEFTTDVVQLGMARGMIGSADSVLMKYAGAETVGKHAARSADDALVAAAGVKAPGALSRALPMWAGGTRGMERQAAKAYGIEATEEAAEEVGKHAAKSLPKWGAAASAQPATVAGKFDPAKLERVQEGAAKYTLNTVTGEVVPGSRRLTLAILAPSEAVTNLSARGLAVRRKLSKIDDQTDAGGVLRITADDLYNATLDLTRSNKKMRNAILNGFAEGGEEGFQNAMDAFSLGHAVNGREFLEASAYGFASGAGMTYGVNRRMPSEEDQLWHTVHGAAAVNPAMAEVTDEDWAKLSIVQKRRLAAAAKMDYTIANAAFKIMTGQQAATAASSIAAAHALYDAIEKQRQSELNSAVEFSAQATHIGFMEAMPQVDKNGNLREGSYPINGVVSSLSQFVKDITIFHKGLRSAQEQAQKDREELNAEAEAGNEDAIAKAEQLDERIKWLDTILKWSRTVDRLVDYRGSYARKKLEEGDRKAFKKVIDTLNNELYQIFNGLDNQELFARILPEGIDPKAPLTQLDKEALMAYLSIHRGRDPMNKAGSIQVLIPQVSYRLTEEGQDDFHEVSHGVTEGYGADFDGDKIRELAMLIADRTEFRRLRTGANLVQMEGKIDKRVSEFESEYIKLAAEAQLNVVLSDSRGIVNNMLGAIRKALKVQLNFIDPRVFKEAWKQLEEDISTGNPDARANFMEYLSKYAGPEIQAHEQEHLTVVWHKIDQVIIANLQRFQEQYVSAKAQQAYLDGADAKLWDADKTKQAVPRAKIPGKPRRIANPATFTELVQLLLPSTDPFRARAQLHYNVENAATDEAKYHLQQQVSELVNQYAEVQSGRPEPAIDAAEDAINIPDWVFDQIMKLVTQAHKIDKDLSTIEAFALIANMQIADFSSDSEGRVTLTGQNTTFAQFLLKMRVNEVKKKFRDLSNMPEQLANTLSRLESLTLPDAPAKGRKKQKEDPRAKNSNKALVTILSNRQMFEIHGEEVPPHMAQMTVAQYVRYLRAMGEDRRKLEVSSVKNGPYYTNESSTYVSGGPMDMETVKAEATQGKSISGFAITYMAILDVVNHELSIDSKGNLHGEIARKGRNAIEKRSETWELLREQIRRYGTRIQRNEGETDAEYVQRVIESDFQLARLLMDYINSSDAFAAFRVDVDTNMVHPPEWLYEYVVAETAEKAELILTVHSTILGLNAKTKKKFAKPKDYAAVEGKRKKDKSLDEQVEEVDAEGIEYASLNSRLQQLLYRMAATGRHDLIQQFIVKAQRETTVEGFFNWLNNESGFRADEAPYVPGVDDVSAFDMEPLASVMSPKENSTELETAVDNLKTYLGSLNSEYHNDKELGVETKATAELALNALAHEKDPSVPLRHGAQDALTNYRRVRAWSEEAKATVGPRAFMSVMMTLASGLYAKGHTKAVNIEGTDPLAVLAATADTIGFKTNTEKAIDAMTASDVEDLTGNLQELLRGGGRFIGPNGELIELDEKLSEEEHLQMFVDQGMRHTAMAMLMPKVVEINKDGKPSMQLLGKMSLKGLIEGEWIQHAIQNPDTPPTLNEAIRVLQMVEASATAYGGASEVVKLLQYVLATRLQKQGPDLTDAQLEKLVAEVTIDVAQAAVVGGHIAFNMSDGVKKRSGIGEFDGSYEFEDAGSYQEFLRDQIAQRRENYKFGATQPKEVREIAKDFIETMKTTLLLDAHRELIELNLAADQAGDPELFRQLEVKKAEAVILERALDNLTNADDNAVIIATFGLQPDEGVENMMVRASIKHFIDANTYFRPKAIATAVEEIRALGEDVDEFNLAQYEYIDWDLVGRSIISYMISNPDEAHDLGLDVAAYPDKKQAHLKPYYDKSYASLLELMFDPDTALFKGILDTMHMARVLDSGEMTIEDFERVIGNTLFNEDKIGQWNQMVPYRMTDNTARPTSVDAEPGVQKAGLVPTDTNATMSAAERTTHKPRDDMFSWVELDADLLEATDFLGTIAPVKVAKLDDNGVYSLVDDERTLAELNTRFSRKVSLIAKRKDGTEIEIEDLSVIYDGLGVIRSGTDANSAEGLSVATFDRIRYAVQRVVKDQQRSANRSKDPQLEIDPTTIKVQIEYLDMDTQPADQVNDVNYEGSVGEATGDAYSSLLAALYYMPGGLQDKLYAAGMQAAKYGTPAESRFVRPEFSEVKAMEGDFLTHLSHVLRRKTIWVLQQEIELDDDNAPKKGSLSYTAYNGIHKALKMRHYVRGINEDGEVEIWSAEKVIEWQNNNNHAPLPLTDAQLYTTSARTETTLIDDQHLVGVKDRFIWPDSVKPSDIPIWDGGVDRMPERLPQALDGQTHSIFAWIPRVSQVLGYASNATIRTNAEARTYRDYLRGLENARAEAMQKRSDKKQQGGTEYNPAQNLERAIAYAGDALQAEDVARILNALGIPFAPSSAEGAFLTFKALQDLQAMREVDQNKTGFIVTYDGVTDYNTGRVTASSLKKLLSGREVALQVHYKDVVVLDLGSFRGDRAREEARDIVQLLAKRGAHIVLSTSSSNGDLRRELVEEILIPNNYKRTPAAHNVYSLEDSDKRYANDLALESYDGEVQLVSRQNVALVFNATNISIEEGSMYLVDGPHQKQTYERRTDNVLTSAFANFNLPGGNNIVEQDYNITPVARMIEGVRNDPESLKILLDHANGHLKRKARKQADEEFIAEMDRLLDRLATDTSKAVPPEGYELKLGTMIPLIDAQRNVYLYRLGYKLPESSTELRSLIDYEPRNDGHTFKISASKTVRDNKITTVEGIVRGITFKAAAGLSIVADVPLSTYGDKVQSETNAQKGTVVPMPDHIKRRFAEETPFPGMGFNYIVDARSGAAKQSFEGHGSKMREIMTLFSWDALPLITETFFPGKGRDPESQQHVMQFLKAVERHPDRMEMPEYRATMAMLRMSKYVRNFSEFLPPGEEFGLDTENLLLNMANLSDFTTYVTLMYLMTPGARTEHVLRSGALHDNTGLETDKSVKMPARYTEQFTAIRGTKAYDELIAMFNSELQNGTTEDGKPWGTFLLPSLQTISFNRDTGLAMIGWFGTPELNSAGRANPAIHAFAYDPDAKSQYSLFYAAVAQHAAGLEALITSDLPKTRAMLDRKDVVDFNRDSDGSEVWEIFKKVNPVDPTFKPWKYQTAAEARRTTQNHDWMTNFRHIIDEDNKDMGWDPNNKNIPVFKENVSKIIAQMNFSARDIKIVHGWIRQMMGIWKGEDNEGVMRDPMTPEDAALGSQLILDNIKNGYMPLLGAFVPRIHVADLRRMYEANKHAANPWRPKVDLKASDKTVANTWDDWVLISLALPEMSNSDFDAYYLSATDGFLQTYANSIDMISDLPVSRNHLVQAKLWSDDYNRPIISSDPTIDRAVGETYLVETENPDIEDFLYGRDVGSKFHGAFPPADQRRKRQAKMLKHRKETGTPVQVPQTYTNMREVGMRVAEESTNVHSFTQMVLNLRVGLALLNPALFVSMGPEQWVRASLDTIVNLLSGTATYGTAAKTVARISDAVEASNSGFLKTIQEMFGLKPEHTLATLRSISDAVELAGRDKQFRHMLYEDMEFIKPPDGLSAPSRFLSKMAKIGAIFQDPTRGVRMRTVANRYINAVLNEIMQNPTDNVGSVEYLMGEWRRDKTFFQQHFPSAHNAGIRRVEDMRSTRQTGLSTVIGAGIDPWADSTYPILNLFGNMTMRMPLMFKNYASNVLINITGMQGLDAMLSVLAHGRRKGPNGIFGKVSAQIRGETELYDPERDLIDMSHVLEGIDIGREFMKSGVTLTGLFVMGTLAGGFGLSGEDKEAKLRRKLAEQEGLPNLRDPRDPANSFLNADMVFLDSLPPWLSFLGALVPKSEEGRQFAELHWILKQFVSPIIGMERFFETGDFNNVIYGFEDAATSFPLINTQMWWQASTTAQSLLEEARAEEAKGTDEGAMNAARLLTMVVGTYENMLMESSFVNQIYVGMDEYDRDPYAKPLTDSNNEKQYDALGNVRPDKRTLRTYMDPETGELKRGYVNQSERETTLKTFTENRFTAALFMSLLNFDTLGSSDYIRGNMPVKVRSQEMPEMTPEQAAAHMKLQVLLNMANTKKAQLNVTVDEILPDVREYMYARAKATGSWVTNDDILAEANRQAGSLGSLDNALLMGIDESKLTTRQARAVYDGLLHGTLKLSDDVIQGISIPLELRNQVIEEWMNELTQEGVDMGLSKSASMRRMKRLMYGPYDQPNIKGIRDLVFDEKINYSTQTNYAQLNTTYVMGPNGMPWATGAKRDGILGALGLKPLKGQIMPENDSITLDRVNNVVNKVTQQNTGWRAVVPLDPSFDIPTAEEIGKNITDMLEKIANKDFTPTKQYEKKSSSGSGWKNYGRRGYRRYGRGGGGGYGGGGGSAYSVKQQDIPAIRTPYGNNMPFINSGNPIIRRADIRRERVWSERGRLKQWQ